MHIHLAHVATEISDYSPNLLETPHISTEFEISIAIPMNRWNHEKPKIIVLYNAFMNDVGREDQMMA